MITSPNDLALDTADTNKSFKQLIQGLSGIRMLSNIELNDVTEDDLYQHIMKSILMYSDVEKCSLFLPNGDQSQLTCAAQLSWDERTHRNRNRSRSVVEPRQFKMGEGILGKVAETLKPYHCKNVEDDPEFLTNRGIKYTGSLICCPITDDNKLLAVINLRHPYPDHFHMYLENIVQTFCHIIARLISNYRLIHQMEDQVNLQTQYLEKALGESEEMKRRYQELSNVDYLTQCYNRRYFFPEYETMIASAVRHDDELSVLVIDLDHFKRLNDNYGHEFGDKVLIEISNILKKQIRKDDLLARMGGEEFVLALHRTDLDGCMIFAERLRATVAALDWKEQGDTIKTTISIGISSTTLHDTFDNGLSSTLLKEADEALYACKENGRNQCLCYTQEMKNLKNAPRHIDQ